MVGPPLHVEKGHTDVDHAPHQRHQRDLRRVATHVKHRLAREQSADADAVQSARELTVTAEDLDRFLGAYPSVWRRL